MNACDGYKRNLIMYCLTKPIILLLVKILYNSKIIGKENIPKNDGFVIACNQFHAFAPLILIYIVSRFVHFIAKKEIFERIMRLDYLLSFVAILVDREKRILGL